MYLCVLDMQRRRGGHTRTAKSSRAGSVEEDMNTATEEVKFVENTCEKCGRPLRWPRPMAFHLR